METKNFRVYYEINNEAKTIDFSITGVINEETKEISAWQEIKKNHPEVREEDIIFKGIEDTKVY